MNSKPFIVSAIVLVGAMAGGLAHARGGDEVQWSVTIGTPVGVPLVRQPYPVYAPPASVAVVAGHPYPRHAYRQPTGWDRDGDGIPNRHDRLYNPRWDVDGDGIPNRRDRVYDPRRDRDGDGVPNWQDRNDGRQRRGGDR